MIRRLSFVALVFLAAGCSGGGGGGTAAVPAGSVNAPASGGGGTANTQVQIVIPGGASTQSARRAQFVSPGTQSLSFSATGATPVVVALTPTTPGCAASNGSLTCTVNVPLPVGANQTFTVATFASTDGSGTPLSTNTLTQSIVAGQANPIKLSLGGVPAAVTFVVPTTPVPSVAATSVPIPVTVTDASGNTIVGSDLFRNASGVATPITLSETDASGGTTLSATTLTAPGSVSVAYDNYFQTTSAALKATSGLVTLGTGTLTFAAKPIIFAYKNGGDPLSFGNNTGLESRTRSKSATGRRAPLSTASTGVQSLGNLLPSTSASAPYTLSTHSSSSSTGFSNLNNEIIDINPCCTEPGTNSFGLATAATGHAYLTEIFNNQTGIFDAGTTPTWPAGSSIIVAPFGPIALGPGGKMYAAVNGGFQQINPVTGAIIGAAVMVPGTFTQSVPNAIAVGKDGTVYLEAFDTASGKDDVLAFTSTTAGFTFGHSFSTANSHLAGDAIYGLAVDASNNVYISCDSSGSLDILPASSQGEVLPARVISDFNAIEDGVNVLIDRAGNIIWATWATVSVYSPNAGSVPPPGTNPASPWIPSNDTLSIQTVFDSNAEYGDPFILLSFGPGS